jgi:hypothetical protein
MTRPDPTPKTLEELTDLIRRCTERTGYEDSADAMWEAALAAFNYVASEVGATGFQASFSALRLYGEIMHVKGPFVVIKAEDALFPQYDLQSRLEEFLEKAKPWIVEQANAKLDEIESDPNPEEARRFVAARVLEHWRTLTGRTPA